MGTTVVMVTHDKEIVNSMRKRVITIEDGVRKGGFGSAVLEYYADSDVQIPVSRLGLPDQFVEHGLPSELYALTGLDADAIKVEILKHL